MIKILQAYNPHDLVQQIEEFRKLDPHFRHFLAVTVGPDSGPEHRLGADIYTAWMEDVSSQS